MTLPSPKSTGTLVGALVAAFLAWHLGGSLGVGTLGGFLCGAGLALWGIEHQKVVARAAPVRIWQAFGLAFLAKLGGLLAGALALRFVPGLSERCDGRSFLVSFGFAALLVLLCGMSEVARALDEAPAATRTTP